MYQAPPLGSIDLPRPGPAGVKSAMPASPSFLAQQTALARGCGRSNCQTLFAMGKVPSDNHIRSMLDPLPPETLLPMFGQTLAALTQGGGFTLQTWAFAEMSTGRPGPAVTGRTRSV